MFLHVVAEFKTTVTQSTMLSNLPGMAFHVFCLVIPDAPHEYFIHQESSIPANCLQQGQQLLSIAGLALCLFHLTGIILISYKASSIWPGSCWIMFASP